MEDQYHSFVKFVNLVMITESAIYNRVNSQKPTAEPKGKNTRRR